MGVVNVTPDSFSDGGRWVDPGTAVEHGLELVERGADLVDVGGESTRPGAQRIDAEEELARVLPVVRGLADQGVRSQVAAAAVEAGAVLVNDVSGGRADPDMVPLVAREGVPVVLMHWRGHAERMQDLTHYDDVARDVVRELGASVRDALEAGVDPERIVVDPGLGFSKTGDQNWSVLAQLEAFAAMGHPLLVAASRKRFLGELLADDAGQRPVGDREDATAAVSTLAAVAGAWAVRVHDPRPSADAVRVVARTRRASGGGQP